MYWFGLCNAAAKISFGSCYMENVDLQTGNKIQQCNPWKYTSGHQSSLHVSGSPPTLNVNWVICGRGTVLSWDLHWLTHTHTRAVSRSSSKEPNKTFTTWLSLPPTSLSICFFGLFFYLSFSLGLPPCYEPGLLSDSRPFLLSRLCEWPWVKHI